MHVRVQSEETGLLGEVGSRQSRLPSQKGGAHLRVAVSAFGQQLQGSMSPHSATATGDSRPSPRAQLLPLRALQVPVDLRASDSRVGSWPYLCHV